MRHKTGSRKTHKLTNYILPKIINPELDKHRREFLGKPGSKQWREYYLGQKKTKQMLFTSTPISTLVKGGSDMATTVTSSSTSKANTMNIAILIVKILKAISNIPRSNVVDDSKTDPTFTSSTNSSIDNSKIHPKSSTNSSIDNSKIHPKSSTNAASNRDIVVPKQTKCDVPYGWLVELFETDDMKDLLQFAKKEIDAKRIVVPEAWTKDENGNINTAFDITTLLETVIKNHNKPCRAEDIKIQYIPFFLQVYMQLIATLRELVRIEQTNDIFSAVKEKTITAINSLTTDKSGPAPPLPGASLSGAPLSGAPLSGVSLASDTRKLLLFNINLLRNMNMYANPMYFDDLYYYYYFLGLDKILPSMDDFFRMTNPPKADSTIPKNNSKTNVKMRVYRQFPNDDPSKEAQRIHNYGYDIVENRTGANPETNFDLFLNLVQLHPDFYYKVPVIAENEKTFLFEETPINKNDPKSQKIVTVQVGDDDSNKPYKQIEGGGKGLFGAIYDTIQVKNTGLYSYLEDSPLYRNIDDLLTDDTPTYDGNVYLCIYSLDYSCDFDENGPTPFLKFIAEKSGDKWAFPSFHFTSVEQEHNESWFKCEMYNTLLNTLEINLCEQIGGYSNTNKNQNDTHSTSQPSHMTNDMSESIHQKEDISKETEERVSKPQSEPLNKTQPILSESEENNHLESNPQSEPLNKTQSILSESEENKDPETTNILQKSNEQCKKIESTLDSMYAGLVLQKIQGTNKIFAFLNYDYLATVVQTPENQSQTDLIFCRNKDAKIYPITDSNQNSTIKWATVDELIFEQKILTEPVDPDIFELFSANDHLWNIQDSQQHYIRFPFVVYGLNHNFQTITVDTADEFVSNGKIENYGEDENIADEYDDRYCFTLNPANQTNGSMEAINRFAMFAWKTRYIVKDESLQTPDAKEQNGGDNNPLKLYDDNSPDETPLKLTFDDEDEDHISNTNRDTEKEEQIALKKLSFPTIYTMAKNKHTNDTPIVVWGVLNSNQFAKL